MLWQGWARVSRAGAAAAAERGLLHSWWLCLYGAPFPAARACVWAPAAHKAFPTPGCHLQPRSEAAVGGERCLIQVLLPSLLQPGRKGLVGCSTPAPGASTPGFLIKKRQEILKKWMVPCWSDCSGLLRALPHQPAETRPPSSFSPSACTS